MIRCRRFSPDSFLHFFLVLVCLPFISLHRFIFLYLPLHHLFYFSFYFSFHFFPSAFPFRFSSYFPSLLLLPFHSPNSTSSLLVFFFFAPFCFPVSFFPLLLFSPHLLSAPLLYHPTFHPPLLFFPLLYVFFFYLTPLLAFLLLYSLLLLFSPFCCLAAPRRPPPSPHSSMLCPQPRVSLRAGALLLLSVPACMEGLPLASAAFYECLLIIIFFNPCGRQSC